MIHIPKVSVILPVYNASRYLECCVDSILNQSLSSIEIICVNDCSTDNSLEILHRLREKDDRIIIIEQSVNLGAGAARNVGMEAARGEYLSFLDADDYFSPEMFKVAVENADSLNLDLFVLGAVAVNEATNEESVMHSTIKKTYFLISPSSQQWISKKTSSRYLFGGPGISYLENPSLTNMG